jgi:hypothetical protein
MMKKKKKIPNLPRIRALLALRKLSGRLQSDVLADGSISAKYNIPLNRPVDLGPDISLSQDKLLTAFRQALVGKELAPILDNKDKAIDAVVSIAPNGTANIKVGEKVYGFAHAGLLSPDPAKRLEYLEAYLKKRTLASVYADKLRLKVGKQELSDDEFLAVIETFLTSQESFIDAVRSKGNGNELTNSDLLPEDGRHWDNLVAPWESSKTLQEYLVDELEAERSLRIAANAVRAIYTTSLSYCAPGLVPIEKYRAVEVDAVLQAVERVVGFPDHFALAGAFEICADWVSRDKRFEAVGVKMLDQLLGDMDRLKETCTFFAAAYAMTLARLAQHKEWRRQPPFWRRVTAAAHASLIVRACGVDNAEKIFKWAIENSGKPFVFSVLLEGAEEPRWKPDWLTPNHLVADAFGRVDLAMNSIPEANRSTEWVERVEKAREWISKNTIDILCSLPAIGESSRRKQPTMAETKGHQPYFEKFCSEPNFETLKMCAPSFFIAGVPKEILMPCNALMAQLHKDASRWDEGNTPFLIQILAFVALQAQDVSLADSVAEYCIEKVRELPEDGDTIEIICRLLECASANPDRAAAMEVLAHRLEGVAYLAPATTLTDLHDSLSHLQLLSDSLSNRLGKATAASRLGGEAA